MSEGLRDEIASLRAELAEVNKVDHDARCPDLLCKNLETAANLRAQLAGAERERDEAGRLIVEINSQFESMKRTAIDHSKSYRNREGW